MSDPRPGLIVLGIIVGALFVYAVSCDERKPKLAPPPSHVHHFGKWDYIGQASSWYSGTSMLQSRTCGECGWREVVTIEISPNGSKELNEMIKK